MQSDADAVNNRLHARVIRPQKARSHARTVMVWIASPSAIMVRPRSIDGSAMSTIIEEAEGPIRVLTINRPHVRNAVDPATATALRQAIEDFEAEACARFGPYRHGWPFLRGCGISRRRLAANSPHDRLSHGPLGATRMQVMKPMIAAVEGYAVAGGLELALMCDLRVMSETAVFGVSFAGAGACPSLTAARSAFQG